MKYIMTASCKECPHLANTESNWYRKRLQLSQFMWVEITDVNAIHESCPLNDAAVP